MLRVFGDYYSGNCYKARLLLNQLERPHEWVPVDILGGETRTAAFLANNPNGKIPLLEIEPGVFLPESNAILCYLADGTEYLPHERLLHARVLQWLFWEQYSHEPFIATRRWRKHFLLQTEEELDENLLPRGRRALGVMELALLNSEFLTGSDFTLADISLVAYTRVAHEGGFDLSEFPAVRAWVHRVERELDLEPVQEAA